MDMVFISGRQSFVKDKKKSLIAKWLTKVISTNVFRMRHSTWLQINQAPIWLKLVQGAEEKQLAKPMKKIVRSSAME